ncbi:hypothetical protein ACFOZ0_33665 [Streptomyces yaanensis]|uniref:Uncharacterized protein n=1 Tax=Streptomyces yaanensis TaxID=1142239 RepID=A0ABV7SQ62_9ACTN|nr:hypothetical protein [Streptomyces sp. CGMCC 4.7035]WNC00351.1 hypothetical protein Q2K21_21045 [Streptomyces sp. CGMCC 4.7035]
MSEPTTGAVLLEETQQISPPDPDREPLKTNVYEHMAMTAGQLMPLFPYDHAGAIVPCGAVLIGGQDADYGHFFHWNTVNEVVVVYGAHQSVMATGQIMATQNLHGVNSYLRDEKEEGAYGLMVVTQHQAEEGDQSEAMIARCQECKAEIVRHEYDATPPGLPGYDPTQHGGAADDRVHQFPTAVGSARFADIRNSDAGRTCEKCGHVNRLFAPAPWGWHRTVAQTTAANAAYRSLREAGQPALEEAAR